MLRRCQESDREELNYWRRRSSEQEDPRKGGSGSAPFSKTHSPHSAESGGYRYVQVNYVSMPQKPTVVLSFLSLAPIVFHQRRLLHEHRDGAKPKETNGNQLLVMLKGPVHPNKSLSLNYLPCRYFYLSSFSATQERESEQNFVCVLHDRRFGC